MFVWIEINDDLLALAIFVDGTLFVYPLVDAESNGGGAGGYDEWDYAVPLPPV